MLVIHSIERLESYMNVGLIIWTILIALACILLFSILFYDLIYEYVSEELDHCNYFGENLNE